MTEDRRKVKSFIICIEKEPNDSKVTKENAIWIPLLLPLIFIPIAFIVNHVSAHDNVSKITFHIAIALSIIISAGLFLIGITRRGKAYGTTKAFFGLRVSLNGFVALVPLCSLLINHFSEEHNTVNDGKYISLIVVFFILMYIPFE